MADNKKMILNLFAGMQDALFLGDRFAKGEFVSFMQPGQFVSLGIQETSASDEMAVQAEIANILVDSSYVNKYQDVDYSVGTELLGSVSQVYEDILTNKALPYKPLTPQAEQELSTLNAWLANNLANYELYQKQYTDADAAYETEIAKPSPSQGEVVRLLQKRKEAWARWESFGQKKLHELKRGRASYLVVNDPSTIWQMLEDRYRFHKKDAPRLGPYLQTFLIPAISDWGTASWTKFEKQVSERDTYEYSKSTSWSGGIRGSWGLWSAGGKASGSTQYEHSTSNIETVLVSFEYLRVRIHRPWLVPDIFGYRYWTWNNVTSGGYISTGGNLGATPPLRPIGRMPVLPQYLIVVRNVELTATLSDEEKKFYATQFSTKASVGWGPFSLKGSYRESTSTRQVEASFDGITFKIQQPQIIARSGILMPMSPSPNRALPWQDDACFPGDPCFTTADARVEEAEATDFAAALEEEEAMELEIEARQMMKEWLAEKAEYLRR